LGQAWRGAWRLWHKIDKRVGVPSKQTAQSRLGWSEVGVRAVSLESITLSEPENQENARWPAVLDGFDGQLAVLGDGT
jgi:hypothetical protein